MTQTKASHERFSLTENDFEKRLIVTDKHGASKTLIVGKSPSFKKTYVRYANEDDVYLIDFNTYQLNADVDDWFDKSLFSISEITKVEHAKVNIEKQGDEWQLAKSLTLAKEQVLEHEDIQQFVDKIKNLRVTGLAEGEFKPVHYLTVVDANYTEFTYQFAEDDDQYFVKRSDVRYWFTVGQSSFDTVAQLSLEKFVSNKESQQEESGITSE